MLIFSITKALKLKIVKLLNQFLKGILVATAMTLLFMH